MLDKRWHLVGLGLVLLVLVTWPLALSPLGAIPGNTHLEATEHLWLLWLGSESLSLNIDTDLVAYPNGFNWVLGDPVNLIWFIPGQIWGGVGLGFNLVHCANIVMAGLAAIWLAREALGENSPPTALVLVAAMGLPALSGGLLTGMTEAQTVGWAGLSLAALYRAIRTGLARDCVIAGILFGITAWGGPYPLIHSALLAPLVLAVACWKHRPPVLSSLLSLSRVAASSMLIAYPIIAAILQDRAADQPGSQDHSDDILADPDRVENLSLGADPLQLILPTQTDHSFEVYLGIVFISLCMVGVFRLRGHSIPLLIPALVGLVLSTGLYLHWAGRPIGTDGDAMLAPAGWLTEWVSPLGRAPRWYRMSMLAGILLAPLAAVGIETIAQIRPRYSTVIRWALPSLMLADALLLSSTPWPRTLLDARPPEHIDTLKGPLLELPLAGQQGDGPPPQEMGIEVLPPVRTISLADLVQQSTQRLGQTFNFTAPTGRTGGVDAFRSRSLLWQTQHGQALGTNPYVGAGPEAIDQAGVQLALSIDQAVQQGRTDQAMSLINQAQSQGFQSILFYPGPHSSQLESALYAQLGTPQIDGQQIKVWPLSAR